MSILIKGMEMPTDCALMLKIFPDGRVGVPVHLNWAGTMVVNDAEAVPVPPHGRLIDKDAVRKKCERGEYPNVYIDTKELAAEFYAAPTIIPAEEGET